MKKKNAYRLLVGMPEGKRTLGRPSRGYDGSWKVGFGDVDWICRAQDRNKSRALVNSVLNLRVA
jgi:hypothetical protein